MITRLKFLHILSNIILFICAFNVNAQNKKENDVVQVYGVVGTADSMYYLSGASVVIKNKNRGTVTNAQGVFSIVALKGDTILFSHIGYKPLEVKVPDTIKNQYLHIVTLLTTDTIYLPTTFIRLRPTREQFERDFINMDKLYQAIEHAKGNINNLDKSVIMSLLPDVKTQGVNNFNKSVTEGNFSRGVGVNLFEIESLIEAWKKGSLKNVKK